MKLQIDFVLLAAVIFLFINQSNFAQQDSTTVKLVKMELTNGDVFIGEIIEESDSLIVLKTLSDLKITIPARQIKNREVITKKMHDGEYWFENPNRSRLFFAPTGRALKAGEGYFAAYEIFFPFIAVGVTDWLTLSGGMSLFPGANSQLFYFAPKLTPISVKNFDASIGYFFVTVPDGDNLNIAYGVGTYGNDAASATLGLGYGFSSDNSDTNGEIVILFGGEIRTSETFGLVSENWFFTGGDVFIFSFGARFFGESISADFGLLTSSESSGDFPFLPWLGFVYNF
ncbi:MAG: hypothetical protein GXO87_11595 [Chlorobi bacterium]|nr:hypothetical protein [Chlorobiota bacterium]